MTPLMATYLLYLAISGYITVIVGRRLHTLGRPFLMEVFLRNVRRVDAVNNLLLVGYYLTNTAFVLQTLTCHAVVPSWADVPLVVSSKIGFVMMVLGGMHFFNVAALVRIRAWIWNRPTELTEFPGDDPASAALPTT